MGKGLPESAGAPRTRRCDVLVVGSGLAGLAAALQARSEGARVTLLEKTDEACGGGNTRLAGGTIAVPCGSSAQDRAAYVEDFVAKAGGRCNREVIQVLAANALDDLSWLGAHGARLDPVTPIAPYRVNAAHVAPGQFMGMPAFLDALRASLLRLGGTVVYETKAERLIVNGKGRIVGVGARDKDGDIDYLADATVLATGGYTANRELLERHVDPAAGAMALRGAGWLTGDGLLMAREIGAGVTHMDGLASLHVAAVSPEQPRCGIPDHAAPYCLSVNIEGRRFHDESSGYVANGKALLRQPAQRAALVFDEAIRQQPRVSKSVATFQRLGLPVVEADSLAALASKLNVPAAEFLRTVEAYNAAVENGRALSVDPPKAALAFPLTTPKFYAFWPLIPGITSSFGGLMIDGDARVLGSDGRALPGLHAAGEVTGGLFFDDYIGGSALASCLAMGRRAGARAAAAGRRADAGAWRAAPTVRATRQAYPK